MRRIRQMYPNEWSNMDEGVYRDFLDIYRMIRDDNIDFTQSYLQDILNQGREILSRFPSGHTEMKY